MTECLYVSVHSLLPSLPLSVCAYMCVCLPRFMCLVWHISHVSQLVSIHLPANLQHISLNILIEYEEFYKNIKGMLQFYKEFEYYLLVYFYGLFIWYLFGLFMGSWGWNIRWCQWGNQNTFTMFTAFTSYLHIRTHTHTHRQIRTHTCS